MVCVSASNQHGYVGLRGVVVALACMNPVPGCRRAMQDRFWRVYVWTERVLLLYCHIGLGAIGFACRFAPSLCFLLSLCSFASCALQDNPAAHTDMAINPRLSAEPVLPVQQPTVRLCHALCVTSSSRFLPVCYLGSDALSEPLAAHMRVGPCFIGYLATCPARLNALLQQRVCTCSNSLLCPCRVHRNLFARHLVASWCRSVGVLRPAISG